MAETAMQRLKRLAAERRASSTTEEKQDGSIVDSGDCAGSDNASPVVELAGSGQPALENPAPEQTANTTTQSGGTSVEPSNPTGVVCADNSGAVLVTKPASTHPIAMEMAELEEALNQQVPGFANILRDIHIKLREDPNTVTLLSEDEIATIVKGLERHANVTLTAKAAKPTAKAKKTPISATDL